MKKIFLIALLSVLTAFMCSAQDSKNNQTIAEVTLISEMDCEVCESKIRQQLTYTRGVMDIKTDIEENTVIVKYRTKRTDVNKIIQSLSDAGIEAKVKPEKVEKTHRHKPARSCCTY